MYKIIVIYDDTHSNATLNNVPMYRIYTRNYLNGWKALYKYDQIINSGVKFHKISLAKLSWTGWRELEKFSRNVEM